MKQLWATLIVGVTMFVALAEAAPHTGQSLVEQIANDLIWQMHRR